jgi:hypothetical protein
MAPVILATVAVATLAAPFEAVGLGTGAVLEATGQALVIQSFLQDANRDIISSMPPEAAGYRVGYRVCAYFDLNKLRAGELRPRGTSEASARPVLTGAASATDAGGPGGPKSPDGAGTPAPGSGPALGAPSTTTPATSPATPSPTGASEPARGPPGSPPATPTDTAPLASSTPAPTGSTQPSGEASSSGARSAIEDGPAKTLLGIIRESGPSKSATDAPPGAGGPSSRPEGSGASGSSGSSTASAPTGSPVAPPPSRAPPRLGPSDVDTFGTWRTVPPTSADFVEIWHGSRDHADSIAAKGLEGKSPTWFGNNIGAARDAIKQAYPKEPASPGIFRARIPRDTWNSLVEQKHLFERPYHGFGGDLTNTLEYRVNTAEAIAVINQYLERVPYSP